MAEPMLLTLKANGLEFHAFERGSGPVVLCLHGFPDHARSYRHQLGPIADAGYRAIAPTMRGYEPSSQPEDGAYQISCLAEDVVGWIDDLGEDKVHLVGHDWGAVVGYAAAALAPKRFHSLTTIAIPHVGRLQAEGLRKLPSQLRNSWYMAFFQLRGLADYVVERNNWAFIDRLWSDWSPGWEPDEGELDLLKETLAKPGVKRAALGYYRAAAARFSKRSRKTWELLEAPTPVPTLAITGALDGCMDSRLHDLAMEQEDFPAGLKVVRVEDAGHFVHQEKPDVVTKLLLEWLASNHPSPE